MLMRMMAGIVNIDVAPAHLPLNTRFDGIPLDVIAKSLSALSLSLMTEPVNSMRTFHAALMPQDIGSADLLDWIESHRSVRKLQRVDSAE